MTFKKEDKQIGSQHKQIIIIFLEYVASESSCHGKNSQPIVSQSSKICCCMYFGLDKIKVNSGVIITGMGMEFCACTMNDLNQRYQC